MEYMLYVLCLVLVFIAIISVWTYFFQTINPNVQYRVIQRGEGYAIQKRGTFKWSIIKTDDGNELIFADKMVAGMVVAEALKALKENKEGDK